MKITGYLALFLLLLQGCALSKKEQGYKTKLLEMEQLTAHTWVHKSFLKTHEWGKVGCNGLVFIKNGEAIVFDTPTNDSAAAELLAWISHKKKAAIKAVVVNHFHADCLGGLAAFHKQGVPSYAHQLTIDLAKKDTSARQELPQNGFENELVLTIGKQKVINKYLGAAHTRDNIVSYIPVEKVLFGGCMIKSMGAGKGNLADADTNAWNGTVGRVQSAFPEVRYVVPGHGAYGGKLLLEYTRTVFPE